MPKKLSPAQAMVIFALGKAYKTHRALLILCQDGYGEDAAILLRSLFELALDARYIARDPSGQAALRWIDYDAVTRYELARTVHTDPYFEVHRANAPGGEVVPVDAVEQALEAQRTHKFWANEKNGVLRHPKDWSGISRRQMARSVGWASHYSGLYALTSILAHSSVRASDHFVSSTADAGVVVNVRPGPDWVDHVLLSAHVYFYAVVRAWLKILKVPDRLREEFELHGHAFVAMIEARMGPDRAAAARLAGALQGDTGD